MVSYALLQDLSNAYSVLSNDNVSEGDFEHVKHLIVNNFNNDYLRSYVQNQEPNDWRWNNDMLRVQLMEMAREEFMKFLQLPEEQQTSYRDCFTMMRSMECFKVGTWQKAGQIAEEINRVCTLQQDRMSEEFKKKWLKEIQTHCEVFVRNS